MIYRLATGARTSLKHRLFSGLFVLAITTGFPVLAAWLNYENLSFSDTQIVEKPKPGSVLGVTTANNPDDGSNSDGNVRVSTSQQLPMANTPSSKPITSRPRGTILPQPPVTPSAPATPVPVPTPTTPATPIPTQPTPTVPEPPITVDPNPEEGEPIIDLGVVEVPAPAPILPETPLDPLLNP